MRDNFNPPHAYWRLRNCVETLSSGRGSLGERLEAIRPVIVVAVWLDRQQEENETAEYKNYCKQIEKVYHDHPPKFPFHRPLKSAH